MFEDRTRKYDLKAHENSKTTSVTLTSHEQLTFEHYVYLLNYAILKWTFRVFRTTDCNTPAEKSHYRLKTFYQTHRTQATT